MICQLTIFVKGFPDVQVSSSVILVYGVTIRWLHFAHAQSICTRPLDQKEVWPGDEAKVNVKTLTPLILILLVNHILSVH